MTPDERAERDAAIVKARIRGGAWPEIARDHGLTERQCRRIFSAHPRDELVRLDPRLEDDLQRMLDAFEADGRRCRERAAKTKNRGAELAALRGTLQPLDGRVELLGRAGLLPRVPPRDPASDARPSRFTRALRRELEARLQRSRDTEK